MNWLSELLRPKPKQTTWAYCPRCHKDLVSSDSSVGITRDGLELFKCQTCSLISQWDFDAPVPILICQSDDRRPGEGFTDWMTRLGLADQHSAAEEK